MASSGNRRYWGAYIGTGSELDIETPGFEPVKVELYAADDESFLHYVEGMPAASGMKHKAGTTTFLSSDGVTLLAQGFKIGADADLNAAGETVYFLCEG